MGEYTDSDASATFVNETYEDAYSQPSQNIDYIGEDEETNAYFEHHFNRVLGDSVEKSVAKMVAPLQLSIETMAKQINIDKGSNPSGKKASKKRKHVETDATVIQSGPIQSGNTESLKDKMARCFEKQPLVVGKDKLIHTNTKKVDTTSSESESTSDDEGSQRWDKSIQPKRQKRSKVKKTAADVENDLELPEDAFSPEELQHPRSSAWYPTQLVANYVDARLRKPLDKEVRNRMRSECPRPTTEHKVAETPEVDAKMITFAGKYARDIKRGIDRAWRGCQDRLLDVVGPLTKILEIAANAKSSGESIDPFVLSGWAQRAICFVGNANCSLSVERRKSILMKINPRLGELAITEPGPSANGLLFGDEFIKEMAQYVQAFQSMERSKSSMQRLFPKKVFDQAIRGRGRSGGRQGPQSSRGQGRGSYNYTQYSKDTFYPSRSRFQRNRGYRGNTRAIANSSGKILGDISSNCGGKVTFLSQSMVKNIQRSLGVTNHSRTKVRFHTTPSRAGSHSETYKFRCGAKSPYTPRAQHTGTQTSNHTCPEPGFSQQYISGSQQEEITPSDQSKGIESELDVSSLQDGGHSSPQRHFKRTRLDDSIRSAGRVFGGSNIANSPEISSIQVERQNLAIHLPSFRSVIGSMGIHQSDETNLYRRHFDYGTESRISLNSSGVDDILTSKIGIFNQLGEVSHDAITGHRISRLHHRYPVEYATTSNAESEVNSQGVSVGITQETYINQTASSSYRPTVLINSSYISGSTSLSGVTTSEDFANSGRSIIFSPGVFGPRFNYGTPMVDSTHIRMERQSHLRLSSRHNHRIRCQQLRMGSTLWSDFHRWFMVNVGISTSYQLSGTFSRFLCNTIPHQRSSQLLHSSSDGQHICSSLHSATGWNAIKDASTSGKRILGVLSSQQFEGLNRISTGLSKHGGGSLVQDGHGQKRLASGPSSISVNQQEMGTTSDRSVCLASQYPTTKILQLETRSRRSSDRCVSSELGIASELRIPSVHSNFQNFDTSEEGFSEASFNNTMVEVSSVASDSTGTFIGFSSSSSGSPTTSSRSSGESSPSSSILQLTACRMAHFHQRWRDPELSAQAQGYIDKSWAPGTTKVYRSAWRTWHNWCLEQQRNPIQTSVITISNFLAKLASDGKSYRSVNVFRSAISAGHNPVSGRPVGEHPLICRLLRGIRLAVPPTPKYKSFWDVNKVLRLL